MPVSSYNIAMVGCGKMGTAMAGAWLQNGLVKSLIILEPKNDLPFGHVDHETDPAKFSEKLSQADILVIAVKPQSLDDVLSVLNIRPSLCVLSIAAGKTLEYFTSKLGQHPIIRAMPNTPASIGKGITVACASNFITKEQIEIADNLLKALGKVEWSNSESIMDAATAVSGSGPAYVFYLIEALADAGMKSGLPADLSMKLARETVIGAAALADKETSLTVSKLRENVTSPNGTTAAALSVLMNGDLQQLMDEAVATATARGKELSQ